MLSVRYAIQIKQTFTRSRMQSEISREINKQQSNQGKTDENSLFNFRWKNSKLDQLRDLAEGRGVTASSIVKNLLLREFETEEIKTRQGVTK